MDDSGRRRPVEIPNSNFTIDLDTLIVAISEQPDVNSISPDAEGGLEITKWNTIQVDENTLSSNRSGVFAGGDVVNETADAISAIEDGHRAAIGIDKILRK